MAMMALLMPTFVFAADIEADLIDTLTLTVDDGDSTSFFEPSAGELLESAVVFNTAELVTTGHVLVMQDASIIYTLVSWTDDVLLGGLDPLTGIPDWDGTTIDATAEAEAICGDLGEVCPDGDYTIELHTEYTATDTFFETVTEDFSIYTTPASVNVSAFAVAPDPFDPLLAAELAEITFTTDDPGYVSVNIYDDADSDYSDTLNVLVDNQYLAAGDYSSVEIPELAWDGNDTLGDLLVNDTYLIQITTTITDGGATSDTDEISVVLTAVSTITIDTFTAISDNGTSTFDPAPSADNEELTVSYTLSDTVDSVSIEITDSVSNVVESFSSTNSDSGDFDWNGTDDATDKLVLPGTYTITITAAEDGHPDVVDTTTTAVLYENSNMSDIETLTVNPSSFDPDSGDTEITFSNSEDAEITVEIYDDTDTLVRTFDTHDGDDFDADDDHSVVWNGDDDDEDQVDEDDYTILVVARNSYGVTSDSETITVDDSDGTGSSSNSHISGIDLDPSSKFEPAEDDELEIEFDVEKDLDSLEIYAVQGSDEIEIFEDDDVEEETNVTITWDGTDDGDYVDEGDWRIEFRSTVDSTNLTASETIEVEYDKPTIDELEVSKDEFDNDLGEFTYIMFKVEDDAIIEIQILEDGDEEETVVDDMEVEADKWYAVQWDGDDFNYSDDLDVKLIAYNLVQEDIYDTETTSIDLDEDDVSSSKSNVTNDYITPILTDGEESMVLYYELEDDADVEISIHKGTSSSGTEVIELIDVDDQEAGAHTIEWDGTDEDGDELNEGYYTYKIKSKETSTETETGLFVVDDEIGDIDGDGGDDDDDDDSVSSNVTIDGVSSSSSSSSTSTTTTTGCGGYTDTDDLDEELCDAIEWVSDEGIFEGYSSGTFGVYYPINRAETLKVIMEAFGLGQSSTYSYYETLGFSDVIVGAWYMPYIDMAMDLGIFSGDAYSTTARPESYVNRVEALKMVLETLEIVSTFTVDDCSFSYVDVDVNAWYSCYVCESLTYNLFDAYSTYYFMPDEYATRGEIALMFYRLNLAGLM